MRFAAGVLAMVLLLGLVGGLPTAPGQVAQAQDVPEYGEVEMLGVVIARFREDYAGVTPRERADIVYRRLREAFAALGEELHPRLVEVREVNGTHAVYFGDHLIVTADSLHAFLNASSPEELAHALGDNLRRVVTRHIVLHAQELE